MKIYCESGTSTITYTMEGVSVTYDVTIKEAELPATGQDFTWVRVLVGAAVMALGAVAGLLVLRHKAARAK